MRVREIENWERDKDITVFETNTSKNKERHESTPAMRLSCSQNVVCWRPPFKQRPDRG